jgi:hypothetical protein
MQRMDCLTREVERLRVFENECLLKDDLIEQLHEEITSLQNFIRQVEVGYCTECHNLIGNRPPRLLQLQKEENPRQVGTTIRSLHLWWYFLHVFSSQVTHAVMSGRQEIKRKTCNVDNG